MFDTKIEPVTYAILVFQVLVLFAQTIIFFARPTDASRFRFLLLVLSYILYNICSGMFPDQQLSISMIIQLLLKYSTTIWVAIYFVCYIYDEYRIQGIKPFTVKSLSAILIGSFVLFYMIPYLVYEDIELSRKLFLPIPLIVAVTYFIQMSKDLQRVYQENLELGIQFRYRIISSRLGLFTLALMPFVSVIGNYPVAQQIIVNSGFIVMMVAYILDFVVQSQNENRIFLQLQKREAEAKQQKEAEAKAQKEDSVTHIQEEDIDIPVLKATIAKQIQGKEDDDIPILKAPVTTRIQEIEDTIHIQMADNILDDILEKLQNFEDNKEYLEAKITTNILAKKFNTNNRYLSFIVNKNKGKTFVRYVNDLRIAYLVQRLEEDHQFRNQYTVKAMAHEIGFTTSDALGRAFKKVYKMKFAAYLKKVRASE